MADYQTYVERAFYKVCKEVTEAKDWYVTLMERIPFYGGSEEGGWWGEDVVVHAFQKFQSEELAEAARLEVLKLAKQLDEEARREYGEQCEREMNWLEARGLDDSYLPEPDGPSLYEVVVTQGEPATPVFGYRHYC